MRVRACVWHPGVCACAVRVAQVAEQATLLYRPPWKWHVHKNHEHVLKVFKEKAIYDSTRCTLFAALWPTEEKRNCFEVSWPVCEWVSV